MAEFDPISYEMKRKKLAIDAPIIQAAASRMLLQPAHGIDYVSPQQPSGLLYSTPGSTQVPELLGAAPMTPAGQYRGIDYVPAEAKVVTPGNTGSSALVGEIVRPSAQTIIPAAPVRETAVPAGKPVGPVGQTLTETPVASASQSRMDFRVVGPGTIESNRFVAIPGGGGKIYPEAPGLVNYARRKGIGIDETGQVPGGNVSQYSVSDPAAVEKRREEGRVAIDQLNSNLDRANIMEGAHGPAEAARAQARIAGIDAVRTKGQAGQQNTALEAEKTKAEILNLSADYAGKIEKTAQTGKFPRAEYEQKLMTDKRFGGDPDKVGWLTDIAEKRHNKTGTDVSHVLNVYNPADGKPVALNLYGRVDKGNAGKVATVLAKMNQSAEKFEKSGAYLTGWNKDSKTYASQYDDYLEELKQLGVRPVTSAENALL